MSAMSLQLPEVPGVLPRDNPFCSEAVESLEFRLPAGMTWDHLLAKLANVNWIGSIVGAHGSGKTTLLERLAPRLEAHGLRPQFYRLNSESVQADKDHLLATVRELRAPDVLLLDGAEQLSTRQWLPLRVAVDSLAGCVVTLHRTGRLPVLLQTETTPQLLAELVQQLAGASLPYGETAALFGRHRGNLRECFRELYDRWAG
jgi:hypothetical protein